MKYPRAQLNSASDGAEPDLALADFGTRPRRPCLRDVPGEGTPESEGAGSQGYLTAVLSTLIQPQFRQCLALGFPSVLQWPLVTPGSPLLVLPTLPAWPHHINGSSILNHCL